MCSPTFIQTPFKSNTDKKTNISPLHRVVMYGALGAPGGVDAAVHHAHPNPVPGDVEGGSLTPLVGDGIVAAQRAGVYVTLKRQIPSSHLVLNHRKKRNIFLTISTSKNQMTQNEM